MVGELLVDFEKKNNNNLCKAEAGMATAKFQRWVATQIWGRDKQGTRRAGQGLASRHPFWCRDLVEVRSKKSLVVT